MSTTKPDADARFCSGARSLQPHALLYKMGNIVPIEQRTCPVTAALPIAVMIGRPEPTIRCRVWCG